MYSSDSRFKRILSGLTCDSRLSAWLPLVLHSSHTHTRSITVNPACPHYSLSLFDTAAASADCSHPFPLHFNSKSLRVLSLSKSVKIIANTRSITLNKLETFQHRYDHCPATVMTRGCSTILIFSFLWSNQIISYCPILFGGLFFDKVTNCAFLYTKTTLFLFFN